MNVYGFFAGLSLIGAALGYATWERGTAEHWKAQYETLQANYNSAAATAKADALAQEQKDTAALKLQSSQAIQQAQTQASAAQSQLRAYQAKLKADAGMKDLGHVCSGVEIPKDLIP